MKELWRFVSAFVFGALLMAGIETYHSSEQQQRKRMRKWAAAFVNNHNCAVSDHIADEWAYSPLSGTLEFRPSRTRFKCDGVADLVVVADK